MLGSEGSEVMRLQNWEVYEVVGLYEGGSCSYVLEEWP